LIAYQFKKAQRALGRISDLPFAIGVYRGYQKVCLAEFLQPFVDEYLNLKKQWILNQQTASANQYPCCYL